MIWFTIALFIVSFLVTALLAPKPEFEDARASSLDDVAFPRATEDAPIPLVLGKVRMNAPNTLWYGDFLAVPIKQKVKTGLFSSKKITIGYEYYLGLDMGLCLGDQVTMTEIWMDEERVWTGTTSDTSVTTGAIDSPELFGGHKGGGGWTGPFKFYPGSIPQTANAYIQGLVGAANVPGYTGVAHIVFEANYIGESNNLRKMAFTLQKYTNDLALSNFGKIGDDMNPMEAVYQICVDPWIGLGLGTSSLDLANFLEVGEVLYAEGNGVSVQVTTSKQGKDILKEILRQIDAIMYQDPTTGLLRVKLIRADYDIETIPYYGENDVIQVRNFTKTAWEDVTAQVKVSFPNRDKESSQVAISQDMATAAMVGRMKTVNMSFPFCYSATTANFIASRERAQQSVPLFQMTLEMNRNAYTLKPGDVFKIAWPEYGIDDLVMRVQKHDLGELLNNKIVVNAIQDSFAIGTVLFAPPAESLWVAPITSPVAITEWSLIDTPFFFARNLDYPVAATYSQPMAIPTFASLGSTGYTMKGGIVSGDLLIEEPDLIAYPSTGTLALALNREDGQLTGIHAGGITLESRKGDFVAGTVGEIYEGSEGILYVGGEWMGFTFVTNNPTTAVITNVYRGLFGSPVLDHPGGSRVYQITGEMFGNGLAGLEVVGDDTGRTTWYYKLLDAVGSNLKAPESVLEESFIPRDEMRLPARPRNLQLAGSRTVQELTSATDLSITWNATDRETGLSYPTELAATETPPETTTYDIEVRIGGVLDAALGAINVSGLTFSIPFSTLTPPVEELDCEIRVWARRVDPDTSGALYLSSGYASLSFTCNIRDNQLLLEGDMQSGADLLLLEGDMQSGGDQLSLEGDEA